jgi:hypothetical protein
MRREWVGIQLFFGKRASFMLVSYLMRIIPADLNSPFPWFGYGLFNRVIGQVLVGITGKYQYHRRMSACVVLNSPSGRPRFNLFWQSVRVRRTQSEMFEPRLDNMSTHF